MGVSILFVRLLHLLVTLAVRLVASSDAMVDEGNVTFVVVLPHLVWLVAVSALTALFCQKLGKRRKLEKRGVGTLVWFVVPMRILVFLASLLPGLSFKLSPPQIRIGRSILNVHLGWVLRFVPMDLMSQIPLFLPPPES